MKFTLNWLKRHLETELSLNEIAEIMTMSGLEVESLEDPAAALRAFSVAFVREAAPHPNADKLQVLQVETIDGLKEIVCGAPNARAGMKSIYAPIGAFVPGLKLSLVEKPVRGVISNGMMCSASELELSDESDGILDLDQKWPVGTPAAEVFGLEAVIDFEVTPNRPDWLGVRGIARDLAASGAGTLNTETAPSFVTNGPCPIKVMVDGLHCPYFAGRVIRGVKSLPSPNWLRDLLISVGLKPINALVDITNLFSLDKARPLHVYDLSKITGTVIEAGPSSQMSLLGLDQKTYRLNENVCAIIDQSGVIGMGGMMGGLSTACDENTQDVFLESALFDPLIIAQAARALSLNSDAAYRFARGVDSGFVREGLDEATALILEICGGQATEICEAGLLPPPPMAISFDPQRVEKLTGMRLEASKIASILSDLGFVVHGANTDKWMVTPPTFRRDVEGPADLVEEIARIHGFDSLPATPLPEMAPRPKGVLSPLQARARTARRFMATRGYQEAITWSFLPLDQAQAFGGGDDELQLANPIASELNTMRPSILPNLLAAAGRNAQRGYQGVRLFELGPIYQSDTVDGQAWQLAGIIAPSKSRHWQSGADDGLFALKNDVFGVLESIGLSPQQATISQDKLPNWYHPGRSARLGLGPKVTLAHFGQVHPKIIKALDLSGDYLAFEINLSTLPAAKSKTSTSRGALTRSNLMPFTRDLAFVFPVTQAVEGLTRLVMGVNRDLINQVTVFDYYQGPGLGDGMVSAGLEITISPKDKTLSDVEIDALMQSIIKAASLKGFNLRA
jgi:phenylalanyl-tRNA synthetase beta chain